MHQVRPGKVSYVMLYVEDGHFLFLTDGSADQYQVSVAKVTSTGNIEISSEYASRSHVFSFLCIFARFFGDMQSVAVLLHGYIVSLFHG